MAEKIIYADSKMPPKIYSTYYAYKYMFKEQKINNGNGMFFLWSNPKAKGRKVRYTSYHRSKYVLLELSIPKDIYKDICIETSYSDWCSFIVDSDLAEDNYDLLDEICSERVPGGLKRAYQNIFDVKKDCIIQTLVPYINYDWIESVKYTEERIV